MNITAAQRKTHLKWLCEITNLPTAAGHEDRVIAWVEDWAKQRRNVRMARDAVGNVLLSLTGAKRSRRPAFIVAHMDHPAFVVSEVRSPREVVAEFRGGVRPVYFEDAKATFFDADDNPVHGTATKITKPRKGQSLFYRLTFRLSRNAGLEIGDIGRWRMSAQRIRKDIIHTPACDNVASVAAALSMLDVVRSTRGAKPDVRVLLTRSEEIGFIGAIGACKHRTIPKQARVIVLETSRSFHDSPIGGGPIVRIGDRLSTFDPELLGAISSVAEDLAKTNKSFAWQRKLMAGGACEATTFCAYDYQSACICLPLGNYHNQGDIANVEAGKNKKPPRADNEFISISDYHRYVHLLATCATSLDQAKSYRARMEELYAERSYVLQ